MSESAPTPRPVRITPQAVATASDCARKLWLRHHHGAEAAPPEPHVLMLRERADAHGRAIAERFVDRIGPIWARTGSFTDAAAETLARLAERARPLHRPAFLTPDGRRSTVPDFAWWDDDVLVVTDVRLALRPETRSDFALQLAHHRAVVREATGIEPGRFEIVNGYGETVVVTPASEEVYADALRRAEVTLAAGTEPGELRGHSACRSCEYYTHCWDRAEAERRIEILPEVQSGHVAGWHALGVRTLDQLAGFDPKRAVRGVSPALVKRTTIAAAAWRDDRAEWLHDPALPTGPLVWLDLEGDARGEDAEVPIYLWGFALDRGDAPPVAETIVAELVEGGDRAAWERFVARASELLDAHPGVRWVHWDHYEPLWLKRYAERHGAPAGFVARMNAAFFDLKRVLDRCVRLPLRSYSVKHIARWVGFAWRNPASGSEWSTAEFHAALATTDPAERAARLASLAEYNEDDLLAMRAIWRWLAANAPRT